MSDDLTMKDGNGPAEPEGDRVESRTVSEPEAAAGTTPAAARRPPVTRVRATTTGPAKSRQPRGGKAAGSTEPAPAAGEAAAAPRSEDALDAEATPPRRLVLEKEHVDALATTDVTARMSAIRRLEAQDVNVSVGAVGVVRAERATVEMGALGGAVAREVRVTQGAVNGIVAREVHLEQAFARNVVAGRVTMGRSSGAFIVLAARVDGEVRSFLDWRAGLALVSVFALVASAARLRRLIR